MSHFAKLFLFLQMKYSIEGYLALLLRSWQTSLTLTKVYPLFIKRSSKTKKTAQIISVVFKCFNNSWLAISISGRGNTRGRDTPRLRSRSKAEEKVNAVVLTFVEWKGDSGFLCLKCSLWKVLHKRSYFRQENHLLSSSLSMTHCISYTKNRPKKSTQSAH